MAKDFLPNTSVARLRRMHKKEKDPKAKRRLLACIHRKEGRTIMEIAAAINEPRSTVTDWLRRVGAGGLGGLHDVKNKGAACKLDKRQLRSLVRDLDAGPAAAGMGAGAWTMPLVRAHIRKKFGAEYHIHSVWDLVRRLGFTHMKPRPRDVRGASPPEVKEFKKKARRTAAAYAGRGHTAVSLDEMHMRRAGAVRRGWYRRKGGRAGRAGQVTADVSGGPRGKATMIGVIGDGGLSHFEFHDAGNAANLEAFLMRAYRKLGKLLVYTDNASYHSKKVFRRLHKRTGGGIVVRFLPGYTPELAPIESQWREIKRYIANLFFEDIEQVKAAVMEGLRRGLIKIVKMHDYLIV